MIAPLSDVLLASDFSAGIPRLKPRVIRFNAIVPQSYVLLASDFSTGIPRLKIRVIKILFDEIV